MYTIIIFIIISISVIFLYILESTQEEYPVEATLNCPKPCCNQNQSKRSPNYRQLHQQQQQQQQQQHHQQQQWLSSRKRRQTDILSVSERRVKKRNHKLGDQKNASKK